MKRFFLFALVLSALSFSACSEIEDVTVEEIDTPIGFSSFSHTATKASSIDATALQTSGFGVYAYINGSTAFMTNTKVSTSAWTYSPVKFWPVSDGTSNLLDFCFYAPYNATQYGEYDAANKKLPFTVGDDAAAQIDALWAAPCTRAYKTHTNDVSGKVAANFKHALSRIGFTAILKEEYEGVTFAITSLKLTGSFIPSAKMNLAATELANVWTDQAAAASKTYTITSTSTAITSKTTAVDFSASSNYIMELPVASQQFGIEVTYTVTYSDGVAVTNTENLKATLALEAGKAYTFALKLSADPIEFTASIADWTTATAIEPALN